MVPLVVLTVFVAFALAILWRPSSVIALAICVYSFEQWAQARSVFFQQHSAVMNYGLGMLTLLALAIVLLQGKNPLMPMTGAAWTWLALFLYAAISCLWSPDRDTSLFLLKYFLPYIVTFVGLLPLVVQDRRDVRLALEQTLLFGLMVMLLLLLGTRIHAWGRTIEVEQGRGIVDRTGRLMTRLGPLTIASMAGHILLIGMLMNFTGLSRIWQLVRWCIGFLALALIVRSQSRGQMIAAVISLLVFLPYSRGNRRITGLIVGLVSTVLVAVIVALAFSYFGDKHLWTLETMGRAFESTRVEYASQVLAHWFRSGPIYWLFGMGSSASYDIIGIYCHVVIVEVLAELGVVGFLGYLLFLGFVARDAIRLLRLSKTSVRERGVAAAVVAVFLFQFILTFKEGSFLIHTFTFSWGLILTRMTALRLAAEKKDKLLAIRRWYERYWSTAVSTAPGEVIRPTA